MKRNETIKRIKKGLKIALVTTLLTVSLTSCGINQEFASQDEVIEVAESLDCDMSYMLKENGNFLRMKHNNGEPIYVCFDDSYSEEIKAKAIESLDYLFGIVGKINDNYHYEVVDRTNFLLKGNKTKIYYTFGEKVVSNEQYSVTSDAHLEYHKSWYNFATENPNCYYYELKLDQEYVNNSNVEDIRDTLDHELMHAFGFNDVYTDVLRKTTTKYYGNTFMRCNIDFDMITPNDLACLISLYAPEDCDLSQMKQYLDKYETKFYKHYVELCKEKMGTTQDFHMDAFEWSTHIIVHNLDGSKNGYEYRVVVENEKYQLEIYDYFTKEFIDGCVGEVFSHFGVLILKDVTLQHGMRPFDEFESFEGGFVQNFAFMRKDDKDILYDYHTNLGMNGNSFEIEKSLTQ